MAPLESMGLEWVSDEVTDNDLLLAPITAPNFLWSESRREDWSSATPEPKKRVSSARGKVEDAY